MVIRKQEAEEMVSPKEKMVENYGFYSNVSLKPHVITDKTFGG